MVYFLQAGDEGQIKIGYTSTRSRDRLRCCQTYHHETIYLLVDAPGTIDDEGRLHQMLKAHHIRGEWFHPTKEVLDIVESLREGISLRDILACFEANEGDAPAKDEGA